VTRAAAGIEVDVLDRRRSSRDRVRIDPDWLRRIVTRALLRQGISRAEICVLLVGDREMARLHEAWLGLPGPTDVITFDLAAGDPPGGEAVMRGDVAVSGDTAARVARELGWSPRYEVAYCVVHGLLHLAGYDDLEPVARRAMRARERVLMADAGLPRPPRRPLRRPPRPQVP
jgi:probable rRNA maturation factor